MKRRDWIKKKNERKRKHWKKYRRARRRRVAHLRDVAAAEKGD